MLLRLKDLRQGVVGGDPFGKNRGRQRGMRAVDHPVGSGALTSSAVTAPRLRARRGVGSSIRVDRALPPIFAEIPQVNPSVERQRCAERCP